MQCESQYIVSIDSLKEKDYAENINNKLFIYFFLTQEDIKILTGVQFAHRVLSESHNCPVFQHLASSITKELKQHGDISASVPSCVVQDL